MRIVVPVTLIAAALAALSSLALARGEKPASACVATVAAAPAEACTASERLCENWLRARAEFRGAGRACG